MTHRTSPLAQPAPGAPHAGVSAALPLLPQPLLSQPLLPQPLLPQPLASVLADFWTDQGVAAHASTAAQAEFAARLLRLAAPSPLLQGAGWALLDEAAISAACLELAGRYGARQVLLTPVPRRAPSAEGGGTELLLTTLRRGCIAATVDSSCAREALEHCQDPAAREVLRQIEHGRARAAQLSWRFLGWALRGTGLEVADQVRVAVLSALGAQGKREALTPAERQLLRHGVLGAQQRSVIEQRVLREVVLPCMENALSRAQRPRDGQVA